MAGRRACWWWLPPLRRKSASAKNWPHLSLGSLLVLATHSWLLVKKILAFDLSRCVELCRVFSWVSGVSALPLPRQDVISVMSVQGFVVSYWLLFTDPMRGLRSISMNWQVQASLAPLSALGLFLFGSDILSFVQFGGGCFYQIIFWWLIHI